MPSNEPPDRIYCFGEFRLMADERILLRDGVRVAISPRLFDLLYVLVENAGRLVKKETLMNRVWEDSFVEEANLNQTISRLRKILGERRNENRFIETVPRVGYRFLAPVEVSDNVADKPFRMSTPKSDNAGVGSEGRSRRSIAVILPVFLLVAAGGVGIAYWILKPDSVANVARETTPAPAVVQLTDDPAREERPVFTPDGDIRFIRFQSGVPRSFVMGGDGQNQRRETSVDGLMNGVWSPDGKKVVFYKEGDETGASFLGDANGTNQVRLPFPMGNMAWSADSSTIVVQYGNPDADIYLYTVATGETKPVVVSPAFDADPSFSPDGKTIVFVSDRDGNTDIYRQDIDGSNIRRLTNHPAHDEFPTFSPDGTQIVFNSNREEENFDVYIMNAHGGGVRKLTNWKSDEEIRQNCWSADGTEILFVSHNEGKGNIYKMNAEAFHPTQVIADPESQLTAPAYSPDGKKLLYVAETGDKSAELHLLDLETKNDRVVLKSEVADMAPKFSPDGGSVVFHHRINGNAEICVINLETGELRNLTNNPARDIQAAWSPDGSRIVFSSNREGNYDIFSLYVVNADGTNPHRIYYSNSISAYPFWSHDGRTILFANDKEDNRSGNFEIFAIEPETVNPEVRLTFRKRYDVQAIFSPDGSRIAFVSNADGNWEIYLMRSDGSDLLRVTRHIGDEVAPSWSADGRRIVFQSDRHGRSAIYEVEVE